MAYQTLLFEPGRITRITLNRPDAANGLDDALCTELADATPRPDIGECLVDGTGFLVAGVSYRSADGTGTWVQAVQEHDGDVGVVTRDAFSTTCEWRPCQVERTPATGEP